MKLKFDIDFIIYGYVIVCLLLIIFNIFYIFYSNMMKKRIIKNTQWWKNKILEQLKLLENKKEVNVKHIKLIERKLVFTNQLMAYSRALEEIESEGKNTENYMYQNYMVFQILAHKYQKKDNIDRAFFAFFISQNPPYRGSEYRPIMEILLEYLNNSTVYCRENVLKAMYAFGNEQAVVNAFKLLEEKRIFHHPKLLADGLMTFQGDKQKLSELLWKNKNSWSTTILLSVVQFITAVSDCYKERFYEELQKKSTDLEVKLAMLRYFQNHIYPPVRELLLKYLVSGEQTDLNMIIVSASVLSHYPSEETRQALRKALHHSNWYVRYNAASSLVYLSKDISVLEDVLQGEDRYAREILNYMLEKKERLV